MVQSVHRWSSVSKTDLSWFAANTTPVQSVVECVQRERSCFMFAFDCFEVKACYLNPRDCILCNSVLSFFIMLFCLRLWAASPFCKRCFRVVINKICTRGKMMANYFLNLWSEEEFQINYNSASQKVAYFLLFKKNIKWKFPLSFRMKNFPKLFQRHKSCLCSVSALPSAEKNTVYGVVSFSSDRSRGV